MFEETELKEIEQAFEYKKKYIGHPLGEGVICNITGTIPESRAEIVPVSIGAYGFQVRQNSWVCLPKKIVAMMETECRTVKNKRTTNIYL